MEEDANLLTREQYLEMLIDASFRDASEMESGFMSWCEQHVPTRRQQGYDETWIRQRIEMAQSTRGLHRTLKSGSRYLPRYAYVYDEFHTHQAENLYSGRGA